LRLEEEFIDSTAVINVKPSESFGHAYMTQGMTEELILQMETDKLILRHVYNKPFAIRFPERREWKDRFQPDR
jgi:hypothetical protein